MNKSNPNHSIECTVDECANHCDCEPCCALSHIAICGCTDQKTCQSSSTQCSSFEPKQNR